MTGIEIGMLIAIIFLALWNFYLHASISVLSDEQEYNRKRTEGKARQHEVNYLGDSLEHIRESHREELDIIREGIGKLAKHFGVEITVNTQPKNYVTVEPIEGETEEDES